MNRVEKGFSSLVLMMMEFPQASPGAAFIARVIITPLKGQIPAQMPQGWRIIYCKFGELERNGKEGQWVPYLKTIIFRGYELGPEFMNHVGVIYKT